ncbi:MAG: polysaccharide biosynthesis tyrosine autokinase [bacterium]
MNIQPQPNPVDPERHSYYGGTPPYGAPYGTPYYGGAQPESSGLLGSLDPFRMLRVMRKKWLTVLLVLVFAGIAATYYLMTTSRVYQAISLVELSVRRPRIMTQQAAVIEDQGASSQSEEIFNTRLEKFKGRVMREAAIARYRKQHPDCKLEDAAFNSLFANNLSLTLLRRTRLVKIEFNHTDPQFAADFCTAFAEAAEASVYDENRIASDAAVTWLEAQCVSQRGEVEKADASLLKYRQENKIDVLESQRKTVDNALMDFNSVLVGLESQEAKERDLLNTITAVELKPENAGKLPTSIPRGDEIKLAMDKWSTALADRDALLSKYTAKHPEVLAKDGVVALYRNQALDSLNRAKATSASNLELFRKQAESLRQKKADQAKLASDLELQIVERRTHLTALERTRDASDTAYRGILGRIQEARMAADENTATVKIVERPSVPEKPIKPKPLRIIAIAILLGLMGGITLALITDTMEDHVTGPHDLEAEIGVKVLAMVPHVKAGKRSDIATASMNQRFSQITEAFAGLRSMLDSSQYKERSKVILVASSIPAEGKTITSCNLAIACAKNGQRVLLIDFDLRRPRLVGIFSMPPEGRGLLDYLSDAGGDTSPAKLAYATECANLTVIASRPVKGASPAELVGSKKVTELLSWARENYDRVIIDAPPLGLVSDALVLGGLSDCVLVMARPETSRKRATFHTIHRFREAGVRMIAAVINDIDFAQGSSYYTPYYHSYSHYQPYPPEEVKHEG